MSNQPLTALRSTSAPGMATRSDDAATRRSQPAQLNATQNNATQANATQASTPQTSTWQASEAALVSVARTGAAADPETVKTSDTDAMSQPASTATSLFDGKHTREELLAAHGSLDTARAFALLNDDE